MQLSLTVVLGNQLRSSANNDCRLALNFEATFNFLFHGIKYVKNCLLRCTGYRLYMKKSNI